MGEVSYKVWRINYIKSQDQVLRVEINNKYKYLMLSLKTFLGHHDICEVRFNPTLSSVLTMGLLGNFIASNVDGVVIELDKEKTPYLVGEKVIKAKLYFLFDNP